MDPEVGDKLRQSLAGTGERMMLLRSQTKNVLVDRGVSDIPPREDDVEASAVTQLTPEQLRTIEQVFGVRVEVQGEDFTVTVVPREI
jgi:hypothetical protein